MDSGGAARLRQTGVATPSASVAASAAPPARCKPLRCYCSKKVDKLQIPLPSVAGTADVPRHGARTSDTLSASSTDSAGFCSLRRTSADVVVALELRVRSRDRADSEQRALRDEGWNAVTKPTWRTSRCRPLDFVPSEFAHRINVACAGGVMRGGCPTATSRRCSLQLFARCADRGSLAGTGTSCRRC